MYLAVICDKQLLTIKEKFERKEKSKNDSKSNDLKEDLEEDLEDITDEDLRTITPLNNLKKALEFCQNSDKIRGIILTGNGKSRHPVDVPDRHLVTPI